MHLASYGTGQCGVWAGYFHFSSSISQERLLALGSGARALKSGRHDAYACSHDQEAVEASTTPLRCIRCMHIEEDQL